jgi:tetratricopeptide (TPR) repeat protein
MVFRTPKWVKLVSKSNKEGVKGNYAGSLQYAQRALLINPDSEEAWRLVGDAYEMMANEEKSSGNITESEVLHKQAIEAWKKAKTINPGIVIPFYPD